MLLWLKTLLRLHWISIVEQASSEDLSSLSQIQTFIHKKTAQMDRMLALKGKLEMAKRTIQLKRQVKSQHKAVEAESRVLVYKDADDSSDSE